MDWLHPRRARISPCLVSDRVSPALLFPVTGMKVLMSGQAVRSSQGVQGPSMPAASGTPLPRDSKRRRSNGPGSCQRPVRSALKA